MQTQSQHSTGHYSPWPHRVAVLLAVTTFPLIWVGGLVTTYDAGMAVPDWPTTFGYNLFMYPWQTWLLGPWDLFIEHGHRLLGALAGLLSIALVLTVWRCDRRLWIRYLAVGALVLVICQGVLGGLRVLLDDREIAKLHGCIGPAFFSLVVAISVLTSRLWFDRVPRVTHAGARSVQRCAMLTVFFAYLQLVIGANLRHVALDTPPMAFRAIVFFHLLLAAVLTAHILLVAAQAFLLGAPGAVLRPAVALVALIVLQICLGAGTWVVNYSWPAGLLQSRVVSGFTIQSEGWLQSMIVTGHVALGSLIVATGVQLTLRSWRLLRTPQVAAKGPVALQGAVA